MEKRLREADKKLISILQNDGRISLSELGKILGVSHVAVRNRFLRLIKDGFIRIAAQANQSKLGLRHVIILLECVNREAEEKVVRRFEGCPRLIFLSRNVGGSLLAIMVAEDTRVLESIPSECAIRTDEGVKWSEVIVGSDDIVYPNFLPLRIPGEKLLYSPCNNYCCDCKR